MTDNASTRSLARILIVDDSAFMRAALARMIKSEAGFEVVGTACSGADALEKIAALDPDVVTLDVQMPGMDGLETLRHIMTDFPRPVIMVSAATDKDAEITFNALSAGAFDCVPKQMSSSSLEIAHIRSDLISKIHAACQARRSRFPHALSRKPPQPAHQTLAGFRGVNPAIVAIATSTGGPRALERILPRLPGDFPVPILIVQHMPASFLTSFAQRLHSLCAIEVHEARDKEIVRPATSYVCPAGLHIRVQRGTPGSPAFISLDRNPADALHIPSADVLMESVAKVYGSRAMGVILTGMGSDGSQGMKAIHQAGGLTVGQDEATCTVYGMPRACAELGVLMRVVPLSEIAREMLQAVRRRMPA
jgi:two-component system, chemotaxis family, protein-glutamate methylesterase/glutaminase